MDEEKSNGAGNGGESSRVSSSFVKSGDRLIFTVELRPYETTIVSWKKLLRDANKASAVNSAPDLPAQTQPKLEPQIGSGQPAENEEKEAPNRYSAVIEKIERLYMGKHSSDEEDLNDIPDDDQYDTEDSFIDDAELDEYFEVDNSAIKHDGFFVNRGNLETINAPPILPSQQPKKRRRKDSTNAHGESNDGRVPNEHVKVGKTTVGKAAILPGNNLSGPSQSLIVQSKNSEDVKVQNQLSVSGASHKKKSTDTKMKLNISPSLEVSNGNASVSLAESKDFEKQNTGAIKSKDVGNKLKAVNGSSDTSHPKPHSKSQSGRPLNNADNLESSIQLKDKYGSHEMAESKVYEGKYSVPSMKTSHMPKKEGSSSKPKGSMLEKALRELEKMVAESRPPTMENQEADTSLQAVKRRLPREVKLKLAKVARLAQANHGKISMELINRLMSILGHLMQLRTLKRNLRIMISMGLSAKQEKDDQFQQIKKEIMEMIKKQLPSFEPKTFEHQVGASDDFREHGSEQRGAPKRKVYMDNVLEDRICDLYDLYVDGLDEDAAPQIRKLYAELAELWPNSLMDNHGIKRAICRAKERRRAQYNRHKDQENIKRKKMLAPRSDEIGQIEGSSAVHQVQQVRDKIVHDSGNHGVSSANKAITSTAAARIPKPSMNGPSLDRPKQEKLKGNSCQFPDNARVADGLSTKRKPELDSGEPPFRPHKSNSPQVEERHKSNKQAAATAPPHKSYSQPNAPSSL